MRWERCVPTHNQRVKSLLRNLFSNSKKRVLFIGGAGFDPRALIYPKMLHALLGAELKLLLIKEQRPEPTDDLVSAADNNLDSILAKGINCEVIEIDVFSEDLSVTGVRQAARRINQYATTDYTDIVYDQSALSIGVGFPLLRTLIVEIASHRPALNVHAVVASLSTIDNAVTSLAVDKPRDIIGFKGERELSTADASAKLWLPIIASRKEGQLELLQKEIAPHDTCPILPFPSEDPRKADALLYEYARLFQSWNVSASSIIYAAEHNPLDLYRAILRIERERALVFERTGGSLVVLSPSGSKTQAIGALMASIERDLPMMYIESLGYKVDWKALENIDIENAQLLHLWLAGDPYND